MTKLRDVIIVGSGLSGTAAALQTARVGLNVIALKKHNDPGYWTRAKKLDQMPGFPEGISGADFIAHTRKQAETFGAVFHDFDVHKIETTETRTYRVSGENGDTYEAPVVVIASGVSKDEHFLAGERELVGRGVYYSVENEAPHLKHQSVAVVGKSEEAARAVLYLAKYTEKLYFIVPGSKLDIPDNLISELEANKRVEILLSSSIKKLNGEEDLQSITVLSAGSERELKCRAGFIYTYNLRICIEFAANLIDTDKDSGRIFVSATLETSRPGVFACGDVLAGCLQNPAVSSAQGVVTGIFAEKYLRT